MTRRTAVVLALASLAISAEASTTFKSSWKAPDAAPVGFQGPKVAAVVMPPDESTRRGVEDELTIALRSRGLDAIPANRLVPPEEIKDKDRARARLDQAGVVGAVVMRAVDRQKEYGLGAGSSTWPISTHAQARSRARCVRFWSSRPIS